jgi:DNA replicative helicase MCM subunit Mcm2 (Cdc46/Mcm family)
LPQTLTIIIEGNFANTFRPGDDITVSGVIDYRYKKPARDMKMQCQLVFFANNIVIQKINNGKDNFDK